MSDKKSTIQINLIQNFRESSTMYWGELLNGYLGDIF